MRPRLHLREFGALLPALRPERRGMIVSYLVGTVSALSLGLLSVLSAWAVGHAVVARDLPGPMWWAVLVALVLVRTVLTWQEMNVSHSLAYRVLARLRMALFDSYSRSVPGRRREHSGHSASVAMDDIEKLEFFYAHTLAQIATAATVLLVSLVAATALLPAAGLVLLAGTIVIGSSSLVAGRRIRALAQVEQDLSAELSTEVVDALGALREVLAYGLVSRVVDEMLGTTRRATAAATRRTLLTEAVTSIRELAVTTVVIGIVVATALSMGAAAPGAGVPAGAVPALVALALVGVSAAAEATTTLSQLHPLVASVARVADGIGRPAVVTAPQRPQMVSAGRLGLRFSDVTFSYDEPTSVVTSWSADIRAGEHVGLAGPSGAGKSTLIALAARLWDPDGGQVELVAEDGRVIPVHQVEESQLRDAVGLVDQEATLFHGTVRDNLRRGLPRPVDESQAVSDDELRVVLGRVGAADWTDLDTDLGQGGLGLSGGQRARLCLARALVRAPRILLVDEVTASLDQESERVIADVLSDYPGTVLVASHREATLRRMSRVLRLP